MYHLFRQYFSRCASLASVAVVIALLGVSSANAAERMIVVLDGSGSMWGQIDGKPKLEIARETLSEVIKGVDDETELGLIAYGHREKGNCEDIELIVPPAAGTGSQIIEAVNNLKFLGKTPLSAAVKRAAGELRYTEDRATVILITDGLETCNANVCEVANQLEAEGVDFTAHVVGFGLSEAQGKKVACLAENTGGRYFQADDAAGLVVALKETIVAPLPEVALVAIDQNDQLLEEIALDWKLLDEKGEVLLEEVSKTGVSIVLPEGDYKVMVRGEGASGGREFSITEDAQQKIEVPVELQNLNATLDAPVEVAAGSEFEVSWTGPDNDRDFITIVETDAEQGKYQSYQYTKKGTPITLTAPDGLGEYEIRYVLNVSKRTLASRIITLTEIEASLEAPAEVAAGSEFEVSWTGPDNKKDFITIVETGAKEGKYLSYQYTKKGTPITLTAPDALGEYEIRYVLAGSDRTLTSRTVTLTAVEASLSVPETASPGGKLTIEWIGPANRNDFITLVEKGTPEGDYAVYKKADRGSPITLKVPKALGLFEVRYVVGSSKRTLASADVTLKVAAATLTVTSPVAAEGVIEVAWTGPANQNDFIEIVAGDAADKDAPMSAARTAQGSPLSLFAPATPGEYRVRYKMRDSNEVIASEVLIVE